MGAYAALGIFPILHLDPFTLVMRNLPRITIMFCSKLENFRNLLKKKILVVDSFKAGLHGDSTMILATFAVHISRRQFSMAS